MSNGKKAEKGAAPEEGEVKKANNAAATIDKSVYFSLELSFKDAGPTFRPSRVANLAQSDTIVMLDTNALLLPYTVGAHSLNDLKLVYQQLAGAGRLLIPARVAREFIRNRDRKMAEVVQGLNDAKSRIQVDGASVTALLEAITSTEELRTAADELRAAKKKYSVALETIVGTITSWRGDDPVTLIYDQVFTAERIIEPNLDEDAICLEWENRQRLKIPPGYKDASKEDGGIGDFLIWLTILQIGETLRKDVTFITGEQKPDWFVRGSNTNIFPRPELISEFRHRSGGRNLRLATLHELLKEMAAPADLVEEVATAERSTATFIDSPGARTWIGDDVIRYTPPSQSWEIRLPYGGGPVPFQINAHTFLLQFSERNDTGVWIYVTTSTRGIVVSPPWPPGTKMKYRTLDESERAQPVEIGQLIIVQNEIGANLVLRLVNIAIFGDKLGFQLRFNCIASNPNEDMVAP